MIPVFRYPLPRLLLSSTLVTGLCLAGVTALARPDTLDNGMTVIFKENHGSPMVASMVFVRSGSKYESRFENGLTHFLEHLLFDGTSHLSREEIDRGIRDLGGYINAFTQQDLTAYLVLLPRQYIEYGMAVQADMLFNSTIPPEELPKERKVVIEEIRRTMDSPGWPAERFFIEKAYARTDYARPVLGYEAFIDNIPREAVIDYWKRYYTPDNMTLLVIGDFDTEQMRTVVARVFGAIPAPDSAAVRPVRTYPPDYGRLIGKSVYDTVAAVRSTYIDVSLPAPRWDDPAFPAFDLLVKYLNLDEVSPLKQALLAGSPAPATEVSVSLDVRAEFSRLNVSVIADSAARRGEILSTILTTIEQIGDHVADPEALEGIKTSVRCQAIYNADKLHYYGFLIAPWLFTTGWEFIQDYPDRLQEVTWEDCRRAAADWLSDPDYVATMVRPPSDSTATPYTPAALTAEEVRQHFDSVTFPAYDLTAGFDIPFPSPDTVRAEWQDRSEYQREVLPNGLTVLVKSNPSSRVFAVNILGKDRAANEPPQKAGLTDFVNRCLEKGTLSRSAAELTRDLNRIGANLTLYDNPWIPYDDRYTTPQFSFIKFETIDEFARTGLALLYDLVCYPSFDSTAVEQVRSAMLSTLARSSGSPREAARRLFYQALFENAAYSRAVMGTAESISAVTIGDLREHHRRFYAPNNMILAVVTSHPVDTVLAWVERTFGRLAKVEAEYRRGEPPVTVLSPKARHVDLQAEQVAIYYGGGLPGADSPDAVTLRVAGTILSSRLYSTLRERQGLAYSVGAGTWFDRDFGWWYATLGTGSDNYRRALDGLALEIDKLRFDGPTPEEVRTARNQIWGRLMSTKLSRINQAYYLARDEFLGRPLNSDPRLLEALQQVDAAAVRRVAAAWFRTDIPVIATAGPQPPAGE